MALTILRGEPDSRVLDKHPMRDQIMASQDPSYLEGVRKVEVLYGTPEVAEFLSHRIETLRGQGREE